MFADTLDAITPDRPYRKALTVAEARTEFIKFRGRQFDPSICDRVLSPEVWEQLYRATEETTATREQPPLSDTALSDTSLQSGK